MPFGYLEFSRAKRRELCPHMQACARAPPLAAGGGRPVPGWGWVRVPYLAWFFLNQVSRYDPKQTRSAPELDRTRSARQQTAPRHLDCQQLRLLGCQQTRLLGRKVATFRLGSNLLAPPGRLYKGLQFSIVIYRHTNYNTKSKHFSSLSLSSEHFNFSAF